MEFLLLAKALVLGSVEGLTEFLPVSSTGHLILVGSLIDFPSEIGKVFDVAIQFGAIIALCWEYRGRIGAVTAGLATQPSARRFAMNVVIACLPAVILGLLFEKHIKSVLFAPVPVAVALIIGGMILLGVEARQRERLATDRADRVTSMDEITALDALKVGMVQCFALIPGTSRSGATIVGGMLTGLDRKTATEFSFFLSIPLLFGATIHQLVSARHELVPAVLLLFGAGFLAAFVSAFICVRWILRYIKTHDYTLFGWYRIAVGLVILVAAYGGSMGYND